jgi:hypothetical protein
MMTSCDLSDQVKPFDSASAAAVREFNIFIFEWKKNEEMSVVTYSEAWKKS